MNNYPYIPPFSHHSKINFKASITSELKRYRIFTTSDDDFLSVKRLYSDRLLARGYQPNYILELFSTILDRDSLRLNRNNKHINGRIMPPIFKILNTPRIQDMAFSSLLKYTDNIFMDTDSHLIFPARQPILCLRRTTNLADLIISSKFKSSVTSLLPDATDL